MGNSFCLYYVGDGHLTFNDGILISWVQYINPYYWVDEFIPIGFRWRVSPLRPKLPLLPPKRLGTTVRATQLKMDGLGDYVYPFLRWLDLAGAMLVLGGVTSLCCF